MPFNGAGTFSLVAGNPVVTGTVISSTWANNTLSDIASNGLTNCLTKDGQQTPTANIPMGGFQITGLGNATTRGAAVNAGQIQDGAVTTLASVSGTDTITAASTPPITAYVAGQTFDFIAAGANTTTAVTLNISSVGAIPVRKLGSLALTPGDIVTGQSVRVRYDGTNFQVLSALSVSAPIPYSNKVKNGNFTIWQRGSSFTNAVTAQGAYTADCWQAYRTTFAPGYTASLQAGSTSSGFAILMQRTNGDTSPAPLFIGTSFETINVQQWAGKTHNLSFRAIANGAFNGQNITALVSFGTGTDGNASGGPTGTTSSASSSFAMTGAFQTFNFSFAIPAIATQMMITFSVSPTGTAGANDFFKLERVQLTEGASILPFEERDVGVELFLCKRYYRILAAVADYGYGGIGQLMGYTTTYEDMRTAPSVTIGAVNYTNASGLTSPIAATSYILLYATVTALGPAAWDANGGIRLNSSL
jgi:hypothetical protein